MATFSLTDSAGNPVENVKVDWTSASSLFNYVKSAVLHLIVLPDFLALKDISLSQAAPKPLQFQLKAGNDFQLGTITSEIDVTPEAQLTLTVNATAGSNLFDDDPFTVASTVPPQTGYVGFEMVGTVDLGLTETTGDLTLGVDRGQGFSIGYLKAFPLGAGEPSLGAATGQMFSSFVIVGGVGDLARLGTNDICTISRQGSFQVSGGFDLTALVNPLASVNLPMGVGTVNVQNGVVAGVQASLTIHGSHQIRLRALGNGVIELSYLKQRGRTVQTDLKVSGGVQADLGTTDLLAKLLGAISKDHIDPAMLAGLTADEVKTFQAAIKDGVDGSLQASMDLALATSTDNQALFQFELRPDQFDAATSAAVDRALKGDLAGLSVDAPGGAVAPGVKLLHSVWSQMRSRETSLKINLLGILNLISISNLVSNCEFLREPSSGDLIIKETAQSSRISAITNPYDQQEALRKAMFDSLMVTTAYVVSKAVSLPSLACSSMHFAANAMTNSQTLSDYLNWFVALNLIAPSDEQGVGGSLGQGGPSSCVVRIELNDAGCESLFFDVSGALRLKADYLEIGRRALLALVDPGNSRVAQVRVQMLTDPLWQKVVQTGASPDLKSVLPVSPDDAILPVVLSTVTGDVAQISWWADGMVTAGQGLQKMRAFLGARDAASLAGDPQFANHRSQLQKLMLGVVGKADLRFSEPWGLVSLFMAASPHQSSGYLKAGSLLVQRPQPSNAAASN